MTSLPLISPRFVVHVNGERRCVAGIDGYGVLSAGLTFERESSESEIGHAMPTLAAARLQVGGSHSLDDRLSWLEEDLFVGDEWSVRVHEGEAMDSPNSGFSLPSRAKIFELLEHRRTRLAEAGGVLPARLRIAMNGDQLCTVGVTNGIMNMRVAWARRNPMLRPPHDRGSAEEWEGGGASLYVGGLENGFNLIWKYIALQVSDEVTVSVLGHGPIDEPESRTLQRSIPHADQSVIGGNHTTLRKFIDDDLDFLTEILSDPEVMRYWPPPGSLDRAGAEAWLRKQQDRYERDGCGYWLIIDNDSHQPVGQAGVLMTEIDGDCIPAIGYMIHRPYWRQHYGIDAAWSCMSYIFHMLKAPMAYTLVRPENEPSLALAKKLGMKELRTVMHAGYEHFLLARERLESSD